MRPMNERAESPSRSTDTLDTAQAQDTRGGARRTVAGWLTTIADYGFRRGRARGYPIVPGEENRNRDRGQLHSERWPRRDVSPEPSMHVSPALSIASLSPESSILSMSVGSTPTPSMHSAASRDKVDREASNVPEAPTPVMPPAPPRVMDPESLMTSDMKRGPQRGSEQSSRAQSSDSHTIPAHIQTGTYEPLTVTIWLTVALR